MPAVNAKIRISGQNHGIRKRLGHAHQASVGETHRNVGVFADELQNGINVVVEIESRNDGAPVQQLAQAGSPAPAEEMVRFGQRSLTGAPRRRRPAGLGCRPSVVRITPAEQSNQKAGVNDCVSGHTP